jgi:hypothetical protein
MQIRTRSSPSAELTKILSSQTTGVAPLAPGNVTRQAILRFASQETARPVSVDVPFPRGPRHDAQFSAETEDGIATTPSTSSSFNRILFDIVNDSRVETPVIRPPPADINFILDDRPEMQPTLLIRSVNTGCIDE